MGKHSPAEIIKTVAAALTSSDRAAELIGDASAMPRFLRTVFTGAAILYALYGCSMGLFSSPGAGLVSAVKLPLLYAGTLAICFPILYVLNHQVGPGLSLRQCSAVLALAMSANAVALASYAPVSYFFVFTTSDKGYTLLMAMHVGVFAAAGLLTVAVAGSVMRAACRVTGKELRWRFLIAWGLAYAFVGTQMSWALRPWVGAVGIEYTLLRPRGGSFMEAVAGLIHSLT